jgi:hypothetical protein
VGLDGKTVAPFGKRRKNNLATSTGFFALLAPGAADHQPTDSSVGIAQHGNIPGE